MRYSMFASGYYMIGGTLVIAVINTPGAAVTVGSQVGGAYVGASMGAYGTRVALVSGGDIGEGRAIDPRGFADGF